jgi:Mg2+/Co2+ transporter CorC
MAQQIVTFYEIDKVKKIMEALINTNHNGFPVVGRDGRLRGFVLRKTLCGLLKLKAYSTPTDEPKHTDGGIVIAQAATVYYDTLEKPYPNYPDVKSIKLNEKELV